MRNSASSATSLASSLFFAALPVLLAGSSLLFACFSLSVSAQVIEVNGGSSSLYQTQGGSVLMHGSAYESEVGAGLIAGRLVGGGHVAYRSKSNTYSAGVEEVRFDLPTDIFSGDHRLLGVGVGLLSARPSTRLQLFAGGTSQRYDTPLFTGVRVDQPAAAFILDRVVSPKISFTTQVLAASPGTLLQGLQWKANRSLTLAASAGVGGTSHYVAVSADVKRPLLDVKAAYVDAGSSFHRVGSQETISPEPIHENLLFTVRSSRQPRVTVSGGRQNFMVPANTITTPNGTLLPDLISTSDQLSLSCTVKAVGLTGSVLHSTYDAQSNLAMVISATASPSTRIHMTGSFFQSRLLHQSNQLQGTVASNPVNNTFVTTVQENLTRHYAANQTISYSNGQTSIGYGGSIFSNLLTFSADYETFYVPTRPGNPFQQTLVLDLELNLYGRVTVHAGTFVSPTGKLLYTANMHAIEAHYPGQPALPEHARFGMYVLQGRVVDNTGTPISGAALGLGPNLIFTDSDGTFFLRDNRPKTYVFKVFTGQFLDGFNYRVVSQPVQVTSVKTEDQHLLIIVAREDGPPPIAKACDPAAGVRKKQASSTSQPPCLAQVANSSTGGAHPRSSVSR